MTEFTSFWIVFLTDLRIDDEVLDVSRVVRPSIEVLSYIDVSNVRRKGVITKRLTVNKSAFSRYPRFEPLHEFRVSLRSSQNSKLTAELSGGRLSKTTLPAVGTREEQ